MFLLPPGIQRVHYSFRSGKRSICFRYTGQIISTNWQFFGSIKFQIQDVVIGGHPASWNSFSTRYSSAVSSDPSALFSSSLQVISSRISLNDFLPVRPSVGNQTPPWRRTHHPGIMMILLGDFSNLHHHRLDAFRFKGIKSMAQVNLGTRRSDSALSSTSSRFSLILMIPTIIVCCFFIDREAQV